MQKGQKHHYIPKFYLKQWTGADGRLCEYSRSHKEVKPHRRHPDATGFECGLYTLTTYPEPTSEIVERTLMWARDHYAHQALRLLLDHKISSLDDHTRSGWARFIISLMRRSPEAVRDLNEKLQAALIEGRSVRSSEELDAETRLAVVERQRAFLLQDTINNQRNGNRLVNMRWSILSIKDQRHTLLTSDRPYVMTNGIGYPHSHIAIPISPTQCFIAAATEDEERKLKTIPTSAILQHMNERMALQARKFVYSVDDRQLRFVAKRFGKKLSAGPGDV